MYYCFRSVTSGAIRGHLHQHQDSVVPKPQPVTHYLEDIPSESISDNDAGIFDADYFVPPSSRTCIKRLAERRGPAMGTHIKPQNNMSAGGNDASYLSSTVLEDDERSAPLASALEATLTSCSSADDSFLNQSAVKAISCNAQATSSAVTLRPSESLCNTLAWSVDNSTPEVNVPKSLAISSNQQDMTKSTSSSSSSGNSSPSSSVNTSAPDFGAAVLERMLASLSTTPSVENPSSEHEETASLQPVKPKRDVPWDTFYSTCPWDYDQSKKLEESIVTTLNRQSSDTITGSSDGETTATPVATRPVAEQLSVNPRENPNRNSSGADSGLGGMDPAVLSHQPEPLPSKCS